MTKILILGGYGFMGKNLNIEFENSGYEIINESRRTDCDLTNYDQLLNKLIAINPDIIIYAAAHVGSIGYVTKYAADVVHDNTLMYINLYKAINEINRDILVINPISNCSYPGIIDIQKETDWWNGQIHESVESYGTPKKMGYIISECYRKQHGIKTLNLIVPNAYGPNDYVDPERTHALNGIIMRMIKSQNNDDKTFTVWGSGTPIREWIYMPDMCRIIKDIIDNRKFHLPNPINIGQHNGVTINDIVDSVMKNLNYDVQIEKDLAKQDGAPIKVLDNKLFSVHFPDFTFTDFNNGINKTINYYQKIL